MIRAPTPHVVDRLGDGVVLRHLRALILEPVVQFLNKRTGSRCLTASRIAAGRPFMRRIAEFYRIEADCTAQ